MSLDWYSDVKQFQKKFGFAAPSKPTPLSTNVAIARGKLLDEEVDELDMAMAVNDVVGIADGIADIIYILLGTAVRCGIDMRPIWNEVHRSNMEKTVGDAGGDGRMVKPEGWYPPQIAKVLGVDATYDRIAKEYFDMRHRTCRNFDAATKAFLSQQRLFLKTPILEIGAGRGRCLEFTGRPAMVHVDSSIEMLKLTPREPGLGVLSDARYLPFTDNSFSAVVAFLCDPFLDKQFLREAFRVCQQEILLTTPDYIWGTALRGAGKHTTTFHTTDGDTVTVPSNLYTNDELTSMLTDVGFNNINIVSTKLPPDTKDVSPAVIKAAENMEIAWQDLPLVTIIQATKP